MKKQGHGLRICQQFQLVYGHQYDLLLVKVNNRNLYFLPQLVDQWKGYNVYRTLLIVWAMHHSLHNNQLPWNRRPAGIPAGCRKLLVTSKGASDTLMIKPKRICGG